MWPFKRKQNQASLPQEVQEYYQAERRERVGIAWILALVTLVVTVLLAIGLFFGGRWVYQRVFDNDEGASTVEDVERDDESTDTQEADDADDQIADDSDTSSQDSDDEDITSLPGDNEDEETSTEGSSDEDENSPERTPNTGALPNTGPE